jgi:hypothetical protein
LMDRLVVVARVAIVRGRVEDALLKDISFFL